MTFANFFTLSVYIIYQAVILFSFFKTKRFISAFVINLLQGICALFAINFLGQYISVHIPINGWTLGISSSGGISGVIMLLLCDTFM